MKRKTIGWSVALGVALTALVALMVYAASVTVDDFNSGQQALAVPQGNPPASEALDVSGVLGGERDLYLAHISGSGSVYLDVDQGAGEGSNRFAYTSGDGARGWGSATWDGNDNDATTLDRVGLGGYDLTGGGTNDGILVRIVNDDLRAYLSVVVYSSTNTVSSTVMLPGINPGTWVDCFFPFSNFALWSGTNDINWYKHAGAVALVITGTVDASVDTSVDLLEASGVREFGDLPLEGSDTCHGQSACYSSNMLAASHIPQGMRLGYNADAEATNNHSGEASGDDGNQSDDEDGVVPSSLPWTAGSNGGEVELTLDFCTTAHPCYVHGWIDWNRDGDFADTVGGASEHIINGYNRTTDATVARSFNTPNPFPNGYYYARFRICPDASANCDSPDNTDTNVLNGEIEDYLWPLGPTAIELRALEARVLPAWGAVAGAGALLLLALAGAAVMRRRRA